MSARLTHDPAVVWNRTVPRSRLFDALSMILPTGERFVVDTIEDWRRVAGDDASPALLGEADRLVREEHSHRRAHERYNATLIAATPGAARVCERARRSTDEISRWSLTKRLALVVAFEQLTIVLSREVLRRPALLPDGDSLHTRMWRWHAAEEIAHSNIAANVAAQHGIGRARLLIALGFAASFLSFDVMRAMWTLCRLDLEAGFPPVRLARDLAADAVRGLPSLARMVVGSLGCLVRRPGERVVA